MLDFSVFTPDERQRIFSVGKRRSAEYKKSEIIFFAGNTVREMGAVRNGRVSIESIDLWGNRSIVGSVARGGAFAETYALSGEPLLVDAVAAENSTVDFLDVFALTSAENRKEEWYIKLTEMLMRISLNKNLNLLGRIYCTSQKSVRSRIMTYLSGEAMTKGKNKIVIPFDRQQMADYLNVERSALSRELGRMKKDGILEYRKNEFILKTDK